MNRWSLLLPLLAAAGPATSHQLGLRLFKHDEIVVIELTNTSDAALQITQLDVIESALNVYLYDPVTKDLQEAFATSFANPKGPKRTIPMLRPGETRTLRLTTENIEKYFFRVPRCYYLVANYRDRRGETKISSPTSNAVQICTSDPTGQTR